MFLKFVYERANLWKCWFYYRKTYDSEDRDDEGNRTGNVTGKRVFTYVVDDKDGRKELGYKSYRSKEGASGKTNNTMTYSTEIQKCFKSKS